MKSLLGGIIGGFLTILLMGAPDTIETVHERTVTRLIPGTSKTVTVVQKVCDTRTVAKLLNEVIDATLQTGDSSSDQTATSSASGGEVSTNQVADARSGDAIAGQVIKALAVCGSVEINATNDVSDVDLETGDVTAENDADTDLFDLHLGSTSLPSDRSTSSPSVRATASLVPSSSATATSSVSGGGP